MSQAQSGKWLAKTQMETCSISPKLARKQHPSIMGNESQGNYSVVLARGLKIWFSSEFRIGTALQDTTPRTYLN